MKDKFNLIGGGETQARIMERLRFPTSSQQSLLPTTSHLQYMKRELIPVNMMPDGTCRTIKAQYAQTSFANFIRGGAFGATGVELIEDDLQDLPISERSE